MIAIEPSQSTSSAPPKRHPMHKPPTTATAVLLLTATPGIPVGPNLSALGNVLPGYSVTWSGCVIGAAWAALIGAILGFLIATCWNFTHAVLVGLVALLFQPRQSAPK